MTDYKMADMLPYNDYGKWIRQKFPFKTQKISVDAGFSCPNRDGKTGWGGCSFCNNSTFNPAYCNKLKSITEQLEEGKRFFGRKYPHMRYLAYFQAFTNTYAPLDELKRKYEEALAVKDVVGIVIGTRPDCVDEGILNYLEKLAKQTFICIEYGIESTNDDILRQINRGHTFGCSIKAIEETAQRGIITGGHLIIGLPGENRNETIKQADIISALPLNILKLHQLQIIRGTKMEKRFTEEHFHLYSAEEYIELISEYLEHLRDDIVVERFVSQSPKSMLVAPDWGLKNHEFTDKLVNYMKKRGACQGRLYNGLE